MQKALVALMMAVVALAGCLGDDEPTPGTGTPTTGAPEPFMSPIGLDHDHNVPELHDIANNMVEVAYHPLREGTIATISEIDVAGGHAFVAEMGFGFHIFDLADPLNPVLVSSTELEIPDQQLPTDVYMADLKVDATGDWVFVATELSTTPGVLIYDARDKTNPVIAGFWPEPGLLLGCHMIEYFVQAEQEYLACAPLDNAIYIGMILPEVNGVREIVQVARWVPTTTKFVQQQSASMINYVQTQDPAGAALHWVSGHQDMTYQVDPFTGTPYMSVSFWNLGLRWVDLTNPILPLEVGSWQGEDGELYGGNLHTAMMFESNDKRMAVAIPEVASPPALFVLDATDFNAPILSAEWQAVNDTQGQDGTFSMHNFQIVDEKIYLTMYHGGIWVLDVSTEENHAAPEVLGTYMPFDRRPDTYGRGLNGGIMSWDLVVHHGYIITANQGGFYVLALEGDPTGDESYNSAA